MAEQTLPAGRQVTLEQIMAEFEEGLRVCEAEIEKVQKARDGARANVKTLGRELAGLGKRRTSLLHALGRVDEGRSRKRLPAAAGLPAGQAGVKKP